jgi:hypothetical protein
VPSHEELQRSLTPEIAEAIGNVLEYSWHDELKDAEEMVEENDGFEGHVFNHLVTINNWLSGLNKTPEEYIQEHEG